MLFSNLEYIPMRVARRFLFRDPFLLRFGQFLPHYRVNRNQADPRPLINDYERHFLKQNYSPSGRLVLEIGVGATNSTGYEFATRFSSRGVVLFEPFVEFAEADDTALLAAIAKRKGIPAESIASKVSRIKSLRPVPTGSIDLILSSSVLEHVSEPDALFTELRRVLKPGGAMLHLVDYRDHFFKYPLHFLQFSQKTWSRWLNPGDLPRWRAYDQLEQLEKAGFTARIIEQTREDAALAEIAPYLAPDFRSGDPLLGVGTATIWSTLEKK